MSACERFRELIWALPDELTPEESAELEVHLGDCAGCRAEAATRASVRDSLAAGAGEEAPGDEVLERVRARLEPPAAPATGGEVLTPEELAALWSVAVEDIYENLEVLPAFEFAGHVRFRRRAIEQWMDEQEQRWRRESLAASARAATRGRE